MRRSAEGRRFYRLTRSSPLSANDIAPQGQQPGYRARPGITPALRESIMNGVSVFDVIAAARAQNDVFVQRRDGSPSRFIATLTIPMATAIECDDLFGNRHHWDLYGTVTELLACVTPPDFEL